MDRLTNISQTIVDARRDELQGFYPAYADPLPGSRLKLDDDILWLGQFSCRVIWGHDHPDFINILCPDFGDFTLNIDGTDGAITDRAPADPQDLPAMPLWEDDEEEGGQQEQSHGRDDDHSRQMGGKKHRRRDPRPLTLEQKRKILAETLERLGEETVRRAKDRIRKLHPELVEPSRAR